MVSEYFKNRWAPGTLVMMTSSRLDTKLLGIVCSVDEMAMPMIGGGHETYERVFIKWFHDKYTQVSAYSSPAACLKIVSEVDLTNDK